MHRAPSTKEPTTFVASGGARRTLETSYYAILPSFEINKSWRVPFLSYGWFYHDGFIGQFQGLHRGWMNNQMLFTTILSFSMQTRMLQKNQYSIFVP